MTPELSIGAHIVNTNQPGLPQLNEESLPTILLVGLGFTASDKVFLTTEIEKDLSYALIWKSGLEYKAHKKFAARTGFSVQPQAGFGGFSWKVGKFNLDYAIQYNMNVGMSHQATVTYLFKPKR